ncbi:MAG: YHYH protein [Cyclobacteriaceae bacterium]
MKNVKSMVLYLLALTFITACGSDEPIDMDDDSGGGSVDISVIASKFYNTDNMTVTVGENTVTITSTNQPDHKSMYYPTSHALYEDYDEPSNNEFKQNPNSIVAQNLIFKIPRYPVVATTKSSTSLGPMGISINSVVFYNQNAAPGDDILDELNTFDQYEGHPQQQGQYHYHTEPVWITDQKGDDAFLGLLLDGFPVYGPVENGKRLTNSDLDDYHGHTSATADFPDGIYHYHVTDELPWINGDGYYGEPGTFTN